MARTSPCYYISPSAISISPNANGSASDLAVNVVKGAKIKVYSQGISALEWSDSVFQQWTLTGRNRRLADSAKPYTIYARLNKNNKEDGYLVFAPKEADGDNWLDKYAYVTMQGLAQGTANKNSKDYWYIKLGEVSLPTDNARTVSLDTGILGTDQFNTEWNLDPDDMPLRVELSATIDLKDAGDKPYVPWGKELVLRAKLLQGWADTNVQRFHHWTIRRDTGDTKSDATYNYPSTNGDGTILSSGRQMPGGNIALSHARGEGDVFNGTVSSLWTVTAWGTKADSEGVASSDSSSSSSSSTASSSSSSPASSSSSLPSNEVPKETYEKLAEATINILAETVEQFALELSSGVVNYDPSSDTYSPADGIDVMVRATDQKGDVFKLTNAQLKAAGLSVQYSLTNLNQWNACTFSGADMDVASANIPIEAFHLQQNVDVRILKTVTPDSAETTGTSKEIFRSHIALVRNGEDSKEREWIFLRSKTALQFSSDGKDTSQPLIPSLIECGEVKPEEAATGDDTNKNQDGWVPEGWWDEMRGTDSTYHYEYAAYRDYIKGNTSSDSSSSGNAVQRGGHWGDFSAPRIWGYYAEDAVSYRCRFTLAGVEVYQLKCAYTGAFRGTLPLVATLLKRVGSGQEQEVTGKAVVTLKCEGIDYSKTFNVDTPSFTISTTDANTADFVQYLNKVELNGLSVSFTVDGETYNFSIPVIREADEDSVKDTIDAYGSKKFLRKDQDDATEHHLGMGSADVDTILKSPDYDNHVGFPFGKGWAAMKDDGHGASMLEVDKLFVRMKAYFAELEIRKISYLGGNYVFSSAGGTIYYVEWLDIHKKVLEKTEANRDFIDTFRCYLYSDDGTTKTMNWFKTDDQVRCQNFGDMTNTAKAANGVITATDHTTHYWWRRVCGVGSGVISAKGDGKNYEYVDFQNDDGQYGADSDFPVEGDAMVQFGNWTNPNRQGVIMIVVTGDDAPAIIEWQNVGANNQHFVMPANEYSRISPRGEGNIFRGKFISVNEVDGYKGMSIDEIFAALLDKIKDIEQQADKKFEMWFGGGAPHPLKGEDYTTANSPASDWATEAERNLHLQDLYYDTEKDPASDGGRAWRWVSESATGTDGATTKTYYWEEVTDQDTISALEKARDLQNQVDDIVSDGVISKGSEKSELLIEWHKTVANYEKYKEQAEDYSLLDDKVWQDYHYAFFAVGTMLNNGVAYTEQKLTDGVTPRWLDVTVDTVLEDTPTKNAVTYRNTWNAHYAAFAELLKLISTKAKELAYNAQKSADEANGAIDDIVSDGKLDPSEKIAIKRDFLAFYHELTDDNGLKDKGQDEHGKFYTDNIEEAYNKTVGCFNEVGTILNGSSPWMLGVVMNEGNLPVWLQNPPLILASTDKNEYITRTSTINADTFRSKWSSMYAAKSAYIALLSEYAKGLADKAQDTADKKVQTFISRTVPETPYDSGDIWVNTADNNNLLISMKSRLTEQGTTYPDDWFDLSTIYDKNDPRMVLAAMAEKVYEISGGSLEGRGSIKVYLNLDYLPNGNEGDIALIGNSVSRHSLEWVELNNTSYVDTFKSVYNALGAVTITIYSAIPSTNAVEHDLVLRTISWHDPFKNEDVKGNIEILMYNGSSWEMLRESTKAIIENLGDEIRTVVFGSEGGGAKDASGLITNKMFNTLFSQKLNDDKTFTESSISTWLDKKGYLSGATLEAWAKEEEGGIVRSATLSAYVQKEKRDDGTYGLESGIVLSADQIKLEGFTTINGHFKVDEKGNIEAIDANISGTINAMKGKIGSFNIGYDGLYAGSWDSTKAKTISDAWFDTDNKENICYLNSSSLWLEQQVGYFSAGDMAYMMVGLGRGSDPTTKEDENNYCSSAMYVYRNMMSMDFGGAESYYPAAKIISKNAFGCDIALRVVGGLQVHGGVMEKGYSMEYTASGNVNVLDLSKGTTFLLYTSIVPEVKFKPNVCFYFPTLTKLRYQLGISDTSTPFSVMVVIISRKDTQEYMICTQKGINNVTDAEAGILVDNNGDELNSSHKIMGRGAASIYSLTFTPTTGYYVQLISYADLNSKYYEND